MKLFNNFFAHAALLVVCALVMITDVVLSEAGPGKTQVQAFNSIYAKIAGVIFVVDLFAYVGYTMFIAVRNVIRKR